MTCIFCDIVKGLAPSHKIWEDDYHIAILSIYPNTPGVSVVFPKQHASSYAFDLDDSELAALVLAAKTVGKLLDTSLENVGRTGMIFEGFGVDHVHAKLFPMHGTGRLKKWTPIRSNVKKFFSTYEGYLSSHDFQRASDKQLADLAERIRNPQVSLLQPQTIHDDT